MILFLSSALRLSLLYRVLVSQMSAVKQTVLMLAQSMHNFDPVLFAENPKWMKAKWLFFIKVVMYAVE